MPICTLVEGSQMKYICGWIDMPMHKNKNASPKGRDMGLHHISVLKSLFVAHQTIMMSSVGL